MSSAQQGSGDGHQGSGDSYGFEAWAGVCVQLAERDQAEIAALLEQLGVGQDWHAADAHWTKVLAEDMLQGRRDRLDRYAELLAHELVRRSSHR